MNRILIVNADDFGLCPGANRGIVESFERGVVTSTSLMVRQPAADEAAEYARRNNELGVGLHVDFGEWMTESGRRVPRYEFVPIDDPDAIEEETLRQLSSFRELMGRDPTHLDSHQHVHFREPARTVLLAVGRDLGVPVRKVSGDARHCGAFYGQTLWGSPQPGALTIEWLTKILDRLAGHVTELMCHPGIEIEADTTYRIERDREVEVLCDPRTREVIEGLGFDLRSFANFRAGG